MGGGGGKKYFYNYFYYQWIGVRACSNFDLHK